MAIVEDISEHDEVETIKNLLACSGRNDPHEKNVSVTSWDEVRSWKPVVPMGSYTKPTRRKNAKNKKNLPMLKDINYTTSIGEEVFPYRYRFYHRKAGHSSTDVISYDTPSWRYIIDWKTYDYAPRAEPEDKGKGFRRMKRSHTLTEMSADYYRTSRTDNEYHMYKINPTDVIDEKIYAAYKENLTYELANYEGEWEDFRKHFIILQPAKLGDGNNFADVDKNVVAKKDEINVNICINNTVKTTKEEGKKNKKKNKKKKSNSQKSKGSVIIRKSSLPPIPTKEPIDESTDEFPFSIAQMLTTKSCSEVERQKKRAMKKEQSEKLDSSTTGGQSYDFYLPTLKYGNYVHLFNDNTKEVKTKAKLKNESRVNVKLPKVDEMRTPRLTTNN